MPAAAPKLPSMTNIPPPEKVRRLGAVHLASMPRWCRCASSPSSSRAYAVMYMPRAPSQSQSSDSPFTRRAVQRHLVTRIQRHQVTDVAMIGLRLRVVAVPLLELAVASHPQWRQPRRRPLDAGPQRRRRAQPCAGRDAGLPAPTPAPRWTHPAAPATGSGSPAAGGCRRMPGDPAGGAGTVPAHAGIGRRTAAAVLRPDGGRRPDCRARSEHRTTRSPRSGHSAPGRCRRTPWRRAVRCPPGALPTSARPAAGTTGDAGRSLPRSSRGQCSAPGAIRKHGVVVRSGAQASRCSRFSRGARSTWCYSCSPCRWWDS